MLRLIYRLLFLLVAEERDLLFAEDADPRDRARYAAYYSVGRLREIARKALTDHRHDDLWRTLQLVFDLLGNRQIEGLPARPRNAPPLLGLRPLGGLFDPVSTAALDGALVSNAVLAEAILHLSVVRIGKGTRRVNYRDLDIEELGGVYEGLLERTPRIAVEGGAVRFELAASLARKQSGSYYTPDSLVQALIKSALEPVLADRLAGLSTPNDRAEAILKITVCDPACGSGHFLLAAARRLARELALVRAENREPSPPELRAALRDVIRSCIYGVDVNPLAVDLCKLALWIESHQPGKPISFLDAHIRCGNSLIGTTPALVEAGIPDGAYDPVTGDDKEVAKRVKRRNRDERSTLGRGGIQLDFGMRPSGESDEDLQRRLRQLVHAPEDRLEDVAALEADYAALRASPAWRNRLTLANLWTAAFFTPLTPEHDRPFSPTDPQSLIPTTRTLTRFELGVLDARAIAGADALAVTHRFFHWPLEFPEVFGEGGFDVVLGNPPWERVKLQEEEFFNARSAAIANAKNKAARQKLIDLLAETDPALAEDFAAAKRDAEAASRFLRAGGRFPLTAVGDINYYAVFAEQFRAILNRRGRAGLVCPTGIATDDTTKQFFDALGRDRALASLYDFENSAPIFPGVHRSYKFCLLTVSKAQVERGSFAFFLTDPAQLADEARRFSLEAEDFRLLNPNTGTCPVFRTRADAELTRAIYRRVPVLVNERTGENPWGISFLRMFDMANDSGLFRTAPGPRLVPLYEAKLFHQFTHRWATFEGDDTRELTPAELADPSLTVRPRYWVPQREVEERLKGRWDREWLLVFRGITNATNERTAIFAVLPRVAVGNSAPLLLTKMNMPELQACLLASLSSFTFDFTVRPKVGGTNLNFFLVKQFPVLPPSAYTERDLAFIVPRVLELVYTAWDLQPFARDLGYSGPPFPWNEERRALLRAELDAYYARLYGLTRKQLRYILDPHDLTDRELEDILDPHEDPPDAPRTTTFPGETFRVLKQGEIRKYGEYRTRRLVLEAWDRLATEEVGAPPQRGAGRHG
ncbi:MAG: hypothetical protein KatS3mg060_3502 [Dehalococcoidia bacterium]|nr:MAG: hypothetical protein KatS3mg060_3502 [Dehalococcoidia bacterium]